MKAVRVDDVCSFCGVHRPEAHLTDGRVICTVCSYDPRVNPYHAFASFRGRIGWFWERYRTIEALPFWWTAREWLRCELRYGRRG